MYVIFFSLLTPADGSVSVLVCEKHVEVKVTQKCDVPVCMCTQGLRRLMC